MQQIRECHEPSLPRASCAGLTRASIHFHKMMDCRVKPGNDGMNKSINGLEGISR
jgi:hypothetical protein